MQLCCQHQHQQPSQHTSTSSQAGSGCKGAWACALWPPPTYSWRELASSHAHAVCPWVPPQVHRFLGMEVGLVQQGLTEAQRRASYLADVTYVTNSELGFDYLRDNLAQDKWVAVEGGWTVWCRTRDW